MRAYHFAGARLRDGRPLPKQGDTLKREGEVVPCVAGLHGSERAIDALAYSPGNNLAIVDLRGTVVPHGSPVDKHAASERYYVTGYRDISLILRQFAAECAMRALEPLIADEDGPLDDAMACAMLAYAIGCGVDVPDEERSAAGSVAESAAGRAAGSAAYLAAHSAADSASAADLAAGSAAYMASHSAAHRAAYMAAHSAASDAAYRAEREAQNARLEEMIAEEFRQAKEV